MQTASNTQAKLWRRLAAMLYDSFLVIALWLITTALMIAFFNNGKIFEQGPPEELFGNPQNDRTKKFLHAVLDAN